MRHTYTDEHKATAIGRVVLGETVKAVAEDMGIKPETVKKWVQRNRQGTTLVPQHKTSLMELLGDYFESNLTALRNQAARMGERAWIEKQTTSDLISSHDILGRRLVSLLDRLRPALGPPDADNE